MVLDTPRSHVILAVNGLGSIAMFRGATRMIRALELEAREGLRTWLRFSDGSAGEVDLSDLAGRGVFRAWDRVGAFEEVHVAEHGAVAWNDETELCPDALYLELTGKSGEEVFPGLRTGR